jgi:methylthioribulose-1-phosphate dehydratase
MVTMADTDHQHDKSDCNNHLIKSTDSQHPANLIPELCRKFWTLGWVTGTGGGTSIRDE